MSRYTKLNEKLLPDNSEFDDEVIDIKPNTL